MLPPIGCSAVLWRKHRAKPLVASYISPYLAEMATAHVRRAPHQQRARMAREIEAAERAIAKRREELATLESGILMFSPDCNPDLIPSVRPYLRGLYFGYRELSRLGLDAMWRAEGRSRSPRSWSPAS